MRIGIIGTGRMGSGLGRRWAERGHEVFLGSRDPERARELAGTMGRGVRGGGIREAAAFGEAVLLATPWAGVRPSLEAAAPLDGKIVIDCTNPLSADYLSLEVGHTTSGAEEIARWAPGARVVKAFNTVYADVIGSSAVVGGEAATLFCCGDDVEAKRVALTLGEELGFDVIDAGPLRNARYLEPLAELCVQLAFAQGMGTRMALRLVRS
jgi:hypothetical protein